MEGLVGTALSMLGLNTLMATRCQFDLEKYWA
jgi:hypothetical protein